MGFAKGIAATSKKMQREVNQKTNEIAADLFTTIINKTPIGTSDTKGQLINNWHIGFGRGKYNNGIRKSFKTSGIASRNDVAKLREAREFLAKDGEVSFTNSISYAWRAEYLGWPTPRWTGRIVEGASYGMVRNSLTAIAAKYRK